MKILLRLNLAALLLLPAVVSAENWSSLEEDTAIYGRVVKVKNTTSTDTCKKVADKYGYDLVDHKLELYGCLLYTSPSPRD